MFLSNQNVSMNSIDWMENLSTLLLLTQSITQSHHKICIGRRLLFLDWGTGLESIILAALVSLSIIRFVFGDVCLSLLDRGTGLVEYCL